VFFLIVSVYKVFFAQSKPISQTKKSEEGAAVRQKSPKRD